MKLILLPCLGCTAGILAGCSSNVYFTTSSSIGLDVSGTAQAPKKISFAFQRFEGAIVPEKSDGSAHSVLGTLEADPFTWFSGQRISQTFATGEAAINAAGSSPGSSIQSNAPSSAPAPPPSPPQVATRSAKRGGLFIDDPLVFVTRTTLGLDLSAGEPNMSPHLLLGYKRLESTAIPVTDPAQEVRPVYADILIDTRDTDSTGATTTGKGIKIIQGFATGRAALIMSQGTAGANLRQAVEDVGAHNRTVEKILNAVRNENGTVDKEKLRVLGGNQAYYTSDRWLDRFAGKDTAALRQALTGPHAGIVPTYEKNLPK